MSSAIVFPSFERGDRVNVQLMIGKDNTATSRNTHGTVVKVLPADSLRKRPRRYQVRMDDEALGVLTIFNGFLLPLKEVPDGA